MSAPHFSIIICSIDAGKFARISESYRHFFSKYEHEIIGIHDATSLAEGYNRGISRSTGEILIFSHDDILFLDPDLANKLAARMQDFDLLGFAGTSKVITGTWLAAGESHIHGVIGHARPGKPFIELDIFAVDQWPIAANIKALDGLCMVATRKVAETVGFDAKTFDGFYLYDLDFSFSAWKAGYKLGVCCDIPIIQESVGNFDERQASYKIAFTQKHREQLEKGKEFPHLERESILMNTVDALKRIWRQELLQQAIFAQKTKTPINLAPEIASSLEKDDLFVEKNSPIASPNNTERIYKTWLTTRGEILKEYSSTFPDTSQTDTTRFHIIIQLLSSEMGAFANTLDSLAIQIHPEWILDIFSESPSPEGLEEIPCIHWYTLTTSDALRERRFQRLNEVQGDWIIEIPPGVKLDPLYLWRLATAAIEQPDTKAFFVDDDCYGEDETRSTPRFKPGCNPAALLSANLAGVLCVQREARLVLEDTDEPVDKNFSLLLGVSGKFGWNSIQHIPDILLSYPDTFSQNTTDCQAQLRGHLKQQGIEAEILHTGKQSWCIRRQLLDEPKVTIAIISDGKYELLGRCLENICTLTQYKNFEILISLKADDAIPDILNLLREQEEKFGVSIQSSISPTDSTYAKRCNSAVDRIKSEFIVFLREEAQVIQETWLGELVRTATEDDVAAVTPRLITPGSAQIENIGYVLGMSGVRGLPYQGSATIKEGGYLDYIQMPRDISLLPQACYLIKKQSYAQAGGMDEENFPDHWADADFSIRLRNNGERLICQPLSNLVFQVTDEYDLPQTVNELAQSILSKKNQEDAFIRRWWPDSAVDPLWNPNLSLLEKTPVPEVEVIAPWQFIPASIPRIFARPIPNGQGIFRITAPLTAACNAGLAAQCVWQQDVYRDLTAAELLRLAPDTAIAQNYFQNIRLNTLESWHAAPGRPFIVYSIDDLMTNMPEFNPFKVDLSKNPRGRLQHALKHCDRLVVSTDYLANAYSHLISDIRVVPNCLEQGLWLPLQTRKRSSKKPRIGWAGGTTHQGDLLFLKEIIERTRDEADWVLMGMCPDEIRPLLTEFHPFIDQNEYPAYLASLNLDIAVAPLAQVPFNQGKSNLRLLEYGILGLPIVCTDIDPYRDSPACCVENTVHAWVSALRDRVHNPEAREAEGKAMRRWVLANYLLEDHLEDWLDAHLPPGHPATRSTSS
jgi:O-antigen biosynthesis protein